MMPQIFTSSASTFLAASIDLLGIDPHTPHPDTLFVHETGNIGIDLVRDISRFCQSPPLIRPQKHILLLDAHQLTPEAQHAFLKTLEECPEYCRITLVTPRPFHLLPTIHSRCLIRHLESAADPISDLAPALIQSLSKANLDQRFTLATAHAHSKDTALKICYQLLHFFHRQLHRHPSLDITSNLKLTTDSINHLQANINPHASLEHLFIHLHL